MWDGITYQNPDPSTGSNYRHIWINEYYQGTHSWLYNQKDLNSDPSYNFKEFVFPGMAKTIQNGYFEYIYQTDNIPGIGIISPNPGTEVSTIEHRSYQEPLGIGPKPGSRNTFVEQIYPNPVNRKTTVSVFLESSSRVSIEISNVTGQQLLTIDEGMVQAGTHEFSLNCGQLNPGIYFCSLTINGNSYTKKMIIE
jgi:hypothetical protein